MWREELISYKKCESCGLYIDATYTYSPNRCNRCIKLNEIDKKQIDRDKKLDEILSDSKSNK